VFDDFTFFCEGNTARDQVRRKSGATVSEHIAKFRWTNLNVTGMRKPEQKKKEEEGK
jgi:hypothetical protein